MKKFVLSLLIFCNSHFAFSQNVGIGTTTPNSSAILELKASDKGFLTPRMDSLKRIAIINPATGLLVYDTDRNALFLFNGIRWVSIDQTNTIGNPFTRPNISYTFSSPQLLATYTYPNGPSGGHNGTTYQSASISENLIVTSTGIDYNSPVSVTCFFNINRNGGVTSSISYPISIPSISAAKLYCFDTDSLEQNIFAVINNSLFRLNIATPADTARIANGIGNASQLKVLANGDIIISTDLNNGSLIRVLPNGTKQIIASNLRFPTYFDIFNNIYYVTGASAITGNVKKITQAGVATTILSDVLSPKSIVFDKNGNFVLQTNVTLTVGGAGNVYIKYDLYDANGKLIGPVNDANDNSILTNSGTLIAPLYIDAFNNLVFMHSGVLTTTSVPNPVGVYGIWLLKMIKL